MKKLLKYGLVMVLAMIASMGLLWADSYVEAIPDNVAKEDSQTQAPNSNLLIDTIQETETVTSENPLSAEETEEQLQLKSKQQSVLAQDLKLNLLIWGVFIVIAVLLAIWLLWTADIHMRTFLKKCQLYYANLPQLLYNNLLEDRMGHWVTLIFAGGLSCLFITCLCSGSAEPASSIWARLGERLNSHPLLTSLLGTFWGLYIIYLAFRPWVCIDPKLFAFGKKEKLKIRLRNFGFFPVHNVVVELHWCRHKGKALKTVSIKMYDGDALVLESVSTKEGNLSYSFHTKETCNQWKQYKDGTYAEFLRCRVIATHSVSGITRVYERHFQRQEFENAFKKDIVSVPTPMNSL